MRIDSNIAVKFLHAFISPRVEDRSEKYWRVFEIAKELDEPDDIRRKKLHKVFEEI